MIFVRYLAREVGRGRWPSYVLRSKVGFDCSTDAALRVERAGKAGPAGLARKGHVEARAFPASDEQGRAMYINYITAMGGMGVRHGQERQRQR